MKLDGRLNVTMDFKRTDQINLREPDYFSELQVI